VFIPIIPLRAYRVIDRDGGYVILAREQLSKFARGFRLAVLAAVVLLIAGAALSSYVNDPDRLARKHVDEVLALAASAPAKDSEAALQLLLAIDELELDRAGAPRAEKVGAQVVQRTAGFITRPFSREGLEKVSRLVQRHQGLPPAARQGASRDALIATLDGFVQDLGTAAGDSDLRLALLRHQAEVVGDVSAALRQRITGEVLVTVASKEADWPLEAFEILMEEAPTPQMMKHADPLVARLAAQPSLLLDAGPALDRWAAPTDSAAKADILAKRDQAAEAKKAVEGEKLGAAELAAALKQQPWNQHAMLQLAGEEASAGKLDEAAARLTAVGAPGLLVREARLMLGQIRSAQGKLEDADAVLSSLIGARLARFTAAMAALESAQQVASDRTDARLRAGDVPADLQQRYESLASDEAAQRELITTWVGEQVRGDARVMETRETYLALADLVPASIALGTVKLRRAQAMADGPEKSAMLVEAERAFLAIRAAAEGQTEFRLGLGEIYARLGKAQESEAELSALLAKDEPELSMQVATMYRTIGNDVRATAVAKQVFESPKASPGQKSHAAVVLALLARDVDEKESEAWFLKADQKDAFVRNSLAELEARKLMRQGKRAACAAAYQEVARRSLATASALSGAGYNNAALAQRSRFLCSGELDALADAEAAMEKAYRASRDNALVAGNFSSMLMQNARLRVLGKRINLRAFPLHDSQADTLLRALTRSSDAKEGADLLAALAAHPAERRGEQIFAEYEVLSSSSVAPYISRFERAHLWRDEAAAAAVVARARKAKGLDTSGAAQVREQWLKGESDAVFIEHGRQEHAQLEVIGGDAKIDARTRAAALYMVTCNANLLGIIEGKPELARRAAEAGAEVMKLWPALEVYDEMTEALIDEAAIRSDAKAWRQLRRQYEAIDALAKLHGERSPLAAAVMASPQWTEVATLARADHSRPGLGQLRLARLLGDAALEERARPALDNKLIRLGLELQLVVDPTDPSPKDDLAYLDRR
jgi:cellulose synthase operon protein C